MMNRCSLLTTAAAIVAVIAVTGPAIEAQAKSDVPKNNFPYTISKCVGTPIAGVGGVQFDVSKANKHISVELREHDNLGVPSGQIWSYLRRISRIKYLAFIEEQCRLRATGKDYQFNRCHPEFESLETILASAPGNIWTITRKALTDRFNALSADEKAAYRKAEAQCKP